MTKNQILQKPLFEEWIPDYSQVLLGTQAEQNKSSVKQRIKTILGIENPHIHQIHTEWFKKDGKHHTLFFYGNQTSELEGFYEIDRVFRWFETTLLLVTTSSGEKHWCIWKEGESLCVLDVANNRISLQTPSFVDLQVKNLDDRNISCAIFADFKDAANDKNFVIGFYGITISGKVFSVEREAQNKKWFAINPPTDETIIKKKRVSKKISTRKQEELFSV